MAGPQRTGSESIKRGAPRRNLPGTPTRWTYQALRDDAAARQRRDERTPTPWHGREHFQRDVVFSLHLGIPSARRELRIASQNTHASGHDAKS